MFQVCGSNCCLHSALHKAYKAKRLKGAIDSRIAEEQARQKAIQSPPSRSSSSIRRSSSRTVSPSKRQGRARERERKDNDTAEKGPDPSEFEPEFVVDDEESRSRVGTPGPGAERSGGVAVGGAVKEKALAEETKEPNGRLAEDGDGPAPPELPTDVRVKLRKLDKLESRYQGGYGPVLFHTIKPNLTADLLRSYRVAHARVLLIEPFETSLRENTPLTSIGDPGALVEYLNQLNLKGDMVLDELKRVSNERDASKQRLVEAEKSTRDAWDEVAKLREQKHEVVDQSKSSENVNGSPLEPQGNVTEKIVESPLGETKPPAAASNKSPTPSTPSISSFSPKPQSGEPQEYAKESEEFFSYDSELPRLESELKLRQDEIGELKSEVKTLKGDLAVARESTESMVQSLEDATRELNVLRDRKDRYETELQQQRRTSDRTVDDLKSSLHDAEQDLASLRSEKGSRHEAATAELEARLQASNLLVERLRSEQKDEADGVVNIKQLQAEAVDLLSEISILRATSANHEKRNEMLNGLVKSLKEQLSEADSTKERLGSEIQETSHALEALRGIMTQSKSDIEAANHQSVGAEHTATAHVAKEDASTLRPTDTTITPDSAIPAKKKNKKRKKTGKSSTEQAHETKDQAAESTPGSGGAEAPELPPSVGSQSNLVVLQKELQSLRQQLVEKDAALERMHQKAKSQEDLQDEIEGLRDDLINVGQEHVEAKDRVKELLAEKTALEGSVEALEKELAEVKASLASDAAGSEQAYQDLAAEFEALKIKATTLQTDLSAAQQLAASRFKDLTNLREILQKAQPELTSLRAEVATLKTAKQELGNKTSELRRLETKHEDLRSEMTDLKKVIDERDLEIKTLNQKISQEANGRLKAEDANSTVQESLQRYEGEKRETQESLDRLTRDLAWAQEEVNSSRGRLRDLEQQVVKLGKDADGLREDIELKTAQHASAQSLMGSMRDQTAEIAMQTKEARERCESLEEELGDARRLLSERSREGETMRRLLADVEGRADSRVRELKERMETAVEERHRAEDEASTIGRKRVREIEDLKGKVRDTERSLKRAEDDKEELETVQKEWKRRREELEAKVEQSSQEVNDVRQAMGELRDALDGSERQARDLENEKADLKRSVEETRHRLEKLQKSNKVSHDNNRLICH